MILARKEITAVVRTPKIRREAFHEIQRADKEILFVGMFMFCAVGTLVVRVKVSVIQYWFSFKVLT
jgi:hypothetical protein